MHHPDEDDAAIIEQSLRRPERFAAIFDRHAAHIQRYLARRLGRQVADDLVAETFLTAFGKRARYDLTRLDARPWLYGIATNIARQHRPATSGMKSVDRGT
jgi:RNA polymerase sigma-70 factor (ECF subfamily)